MTEPDKNLRSDVDASTDLPLRAHITVLRCRHAEDLAGRVGQAFERQGLPMMWIRAPLETDLVAHWCGVGEEPDEQIARLLLDRAASVLDIEDPADSVVERRWQVESAEGVGTPEAIETARQFLGHALNTPIDAVRHALARIRGMGLGEAELFQRVAHLWGSGERPILILAADRADQWASTIRSVALAVVGAAEARLVIVVTPQVWSELGRDLDAHLYSVLHDALMDVAEARCEVSSRPGPVPAPTTPAGGSGEGRLPLAANEATRPDSTRNLPSGETAIELRQRARQAVQLALTIPPPKESDAAPPEEYALARSLAEAMLYAALQADARTAGLFELNADGGFWFGSRQAEIDLLCRSLGIAIEVDGYFHFQDNSAYRRDRAKDVLMQNQGWLVLRFLAEDVTDRLETVLGCVLDAVSRRRSRSSGV